MVTRNNARVLRGFWREASAPGLVLKHGQCSVALSPIPQIDKEVSSVLAVLSSTKKPNQHPSTAYSVHL